MTIRDQRRLAAVTLFSAMAAIAASIIQDAASQQPDANRAAEATSTDPPSAARPLGLDELNSLLKAADILTNKRYVDVSDRSRAATNLGKTRHLYAIPSLLAVVRNKGEILSLRQKAVVALSAIPDKRVVEWLLDILDDEDRDLVSTAARQLHTITGRPVESRFIHEAADWRNWWARNMYRIRLRSQRAFEIYP